MAGHPGESRAGDRGRSACRSWNTTDRVVPSDLQRIAEVVADASYRANGSIANGASLFQMTSVGRPVTVPDWALRRNCQTNCRRRGTAEAVPFMRPRTRCSASRCCVE